MSKKLRELTLMDKGFTRKNTETDLRKPFQLEYDVDGETYSGGTIDVCYLKKI